MTQETLLRCAYLINILLLVPVVAAVVLGRGADQGRFDESEGWRLLTASLWTGILAVSVLGLSKPYAASAVLLLQLVYKSMWLVVYALPRASRGRWGEIPPGIAAAFVLIVLAWPWLIPWRTLIR